MVNEFPILNFEPDIYYRAVLNCNVKYADVSAGDMAEIWTDKRGYLGTFKIAQVRRNIEKAKIVFEDTKAWNALYSFQTSPVPAANQTGTLKIVQKTRLRPKFERYYTEYITPQFTSIYNSVRINNSTDARYPERKGKTLFVMPQGIQFPKNIAASIISSTGKYSGVHMPITSRQLTGTDGNTDILIDIPFNGDDTGVLVYTETSYSGPIIGDKPYIDTTQTVPTVVNPTGTAITVTSTDNAGKNYTQVVPANSSQPIAAPVEKSADPPFLITETTNNLKVATIPTMTDEQYKVLISAKMQQIKADPIFHKLIIDSYKNSLMGYTQALATNAVKELKATGTISIDQFGAGLWGQAVWIRANYPKDDYTAPVSGQPPVIASTNPNPGATPTPNGNPSVSEPIPPTTITPTVTDQVIYPVNELPKLGGGLIDSPLAKIALVGIVIVLIIKSIKK